MERLKLLFQRIGELTFWQRIFNWKQIRKLAIEAFGEFNQLESDLKHSSGEINRLCQQNDKAMAEIEHLNRSIEDLREQVTKREAELTVFQTKMESRDTRVNELSQQITTFRSTEEQRKREAEKNIANLNKLQDNLEKEAQRISDDRLREQEEKQAKMKRQWADHEASVKANVLRICKKHGIDYVKEVPFRGKPDNTIQICGEYIILDAKSPASDDLTNFNSYLKSQSENLKKYAKEESVRKDFYLVVPSNTVEVISEWTLHTGDYNVFVLTEDALETVMLSLKKIEEYEFAEQLSPEERDNICRILSKFAHATKRKVQVDQFFNNYFVDILAKCKTDLPTEMQEVILELEKHEKLNPPQERKYKEIPIQELKSGNERVEAEANIRQISIPDSFEEIKALE